MNFLKRWHKPKGKCVKCGRMCSLNAPSGDWLLALYPRKHKLPTGEICPGTWFETSIEINEVWLNER